MKNRSWFAFSLVASLGLLGVGCSASSGDEDPNPEGRGDETVRVEVKEGAREPRRFAEFFGPGADACLSQCQTQACTDACIDLYCPNGRCR